MTADNTAQQEALLLLGRQEESWNRGDAAAYSADVAEDCWFTNILGQAFEGRAAFEEKHTQIFATVFQGSRLKLALRRFRELAAETAMVEADATLSNFRALPPGAAAGPDGALHTRLLQVMERSNGNWRVVAYHNVDVKSQGAN